jgi:hypothetical protein
MLMPYLIGFVKEGNKLELINAESAQPMTIFETRLMAAVKPIELDMAKHYGKIVGLSVEQYDDTVAWGAKFVSIV